MPDDLQYCTTKVIKKGKVTEKIPFRQRAYFEVLGEERKNTLVELSHDEMIIGRSPECAIRLPGDSVSRRHARVIFRNEEYQIEDLNSTNGLYVNGVKVEKCVLRNKDQIEIGDAKLIFTEEKTPAGR